MPSGLVYTAQLDQSTLNDLQNLESELGVTLVAVEANEAPAPAKLNEAQVKRIQELEEKSGTVLLAFH